MLLRDFVEAFGGLSDAAFLARFQRPFLVEEPLLDPGQGEEAQLFYLHGRGPIPLLIGRFAGADVRLDDEEVSSRHARLIPPSEDGEPWRILDLSSRNGTYVNGRPVGRQSAPLDDRAYLGIGLELDLVFLRPRSFLTILRRRQGKRPVGVSLGGETVVTRPGAPPRQPALPAARPEPGGSAPQRRTAPQSGRPAKPSRRPTRPAARAPDPVRLHCPPFDPIPLEPGKPLRVGRGGDADLVLPSSEISRHHAEVVLQDGRLLVRDLGSTNGTFVDLTRVGEEPLEVLAGQAVRIAHYRLFARGLAEAPVAPTVVRGPEEGRLVRGTLGQLALRDLLLRIEVRRKSGVLVVRGAELHGMISFRDGHPCQASTGGGLRDAEAIRALVQLRDGEVTITAGGAAAGDPRIAQCFSELLEGRPERQDSDTREVLALAR